MRVSGKGKGSKQEWGLSNTVVAATRSQARKPLPAPIFHGSDGVGVQLHAFTDDE